MPWLVQSFDVQTDELVAEFDLDVLAEGAVERLTGSQPDVLTADQARLGAPRCAIDPGAGPRVTGPAADVGVLGSSWLAKELVQLVMRTTHERLEHLVEGDFRISRESAQGLLDRFSASGRIPDGETFLGFYEP